jgi:site-specific DNA-methyltransferase (adenine-specific)
MPDSSVDSIVTDPPYELGFMGKSWDSSGIAYTVELWAEALRVLKPGGHLLAAGGSRTYHRLACAIEDAGFEIRDSISWIYSTGFPKNLDVSKAIDKAAGAQREVLSIGTPVKRMIPGADQNSTGSWIKDNGRELIPTTTAPSSPEAQQWDGWGTALKPAVEPFVLARKPLVGTVANNVLTYGTGALNIDESRVEGVMDGVWGSSNETVCDRPIFNSSPTMNEFRTQPHYGGRWPANLVHDGSDEVLAWFPHTKSGLMKAGTEMQAYDGPCMSAWSSAEARSDTYGDEGPAARFFKSAAFDEDNDVQSFFYCPKASPSERDAGLEGVEMRHPTVKPIALMRYLIKLVTPPGGVVLDPFLGSGTTAVAAILDGFDWIGCEMTEEYWPIIEGRVTWAEEARFRTPPSLFDKPEVKPPGETVALMRSAAPSSLFDVLQDAHAS